MGGWLSDGHGLDLTFVATAPNFETQTNGATHMGNDDITIFDGIAHLKIIDVSCPQQLLGIMKWIMSGNRGLVYIRIMRSPSGVLYGPEFEFSYGKGYVLAGGDAAQVTIVSSGRGVHEALATAQLLRAEGVEIAVVDMPSVDENLLLELYSSGNPVVIAEQNNGYIYRHSIEILFTHRDTIDTTRIIAVNTLDENSTPQFIHSGTYDELLGACGLDPGGLAHTIRALLG